MRDSYEPKVRLDRQIEWRLSPLKIVLKKESPVATPGPNRPRSSVGSALPRPVSNLSRPPPTVAPRPVAAARPGQPAATVQTGPRRLVEPEGKSKTTLIWIVVGVVCLFVVILIMAASGSRKPAGKAKSGDWESDLPVAAPSAQPERFAELNGMTMAEWSRKQESGNKALQERRERMRHPPTGVAPVNQGSSTEAGDAESR